MLKRTKLFVISLIFSCGVHAATQWQQLAPGLSYTTISVGRSFRRGKLHAFKVDLRNYKLDISLAKDKGQDRPFVLHCVIKQRPDIVQKAENIPMDFYTQLK